jgi:hypothetical protein
MHPHLQSGCPREPRRTYPWSPRKRDRTSGANIKSSRRKSGSHKTHWWREGDSNPRSPDTVELGAADGDGLLAEFTSVVDAVRCAVEVQRGMIDREPGVAEERRIRFRIGINLGDRDR